MIRKILPWIVFIWFAFFVNCETSQIIIHKKPETSFNKYSAILIEVDDNGITNGYSVGNQIRTNLKEKLGFKINLQLLNGDISPDKKMKDFLKLTLKIIALEDKSRTDPLSLVVLFSVGLLLQTPIPSTNHQKRIAGDAGIELEGEFFDTKTKSIHSKFNIKETSAFSGSPDNFIEAASTKIANFILENSK